MKQILSILLIIFLSLAAVAQQKNMAAVQPDPAKKLLLAEASCGQCQFNMKGDGCKLAVRIDGKAYFVEGTQIDDHGDAHAKNGFCNAIRKANVQGEIKGDKFVATYFKLLDGKPAKRRIKKA